MSFDTIEYIIFLPVVLLLYAAFKGRIQIGILLVSSLFFYAFWNVWYLSLIFVTILSTYLSGIAISDHGSEVRKKQLLFVNIAVNITILGIFKYYNFFTDNIRSLLGLENGSFIPELDLLLPVGISFYTFQAIGYSIDVYRGKTQPEKNLTIYSLYVVFFPQLVAGPIERSYQLLPQFKVLKKVNYEDLHEGLKLVIWGFFKKLVIADNIALFVDSNFSHVENSGAATLMFAAILFSFQIYCDFSGYSDIAIGSARMMGFRLMKNFDNPYLASSISDFWRRWHISLSTWFRDYVYIPLGGNKGSKVSLYRNILFVFLLSGLWHGASWTFVVWGAFHGIILILEHIFKPVSSKVHSFVEQINLGWLYKSVKVLFVFILVSFSWIIFRSDTITDATYIIREISTHLLDLPFDVIAILSGDIILKSFPIEDLRFICLLILGVLIVEKLFLLKKLGGAYSWCRMLIYCLIIFTILFEGKFGRSEFIYFQF